VLVAVLATPTPLDEILAVLDRLGPGIVSDIPDDLTWSRGWNPGRGVRAAPAGAEPVRYTVGWPSGDRLDRDRTR